MTVEADTLYVTPPGRHLDVAGGRFTVREVAHCDRLRLPIDHFLCTLAAQQAHRCCGVLLSGGGSDGMLGLSEIKACGGLTLAQDPAEAQTPEMPQNALTADVVDLALQVAEMPAAILGYAEKVARGDIPEDDEAALRGILVLLKTRSGHDFRCYKRGTLIRRIRRRAELTKAPGLGAYLQRLQTHDEEIAQLRKDLLIGVTDFFRQPEAWRVLEEKVIGPLLSVALADRGSPPSSVLARPSVGEEPAGAADSFLLTPDAARTLRLWVPGCATGKEAYTLAMLFVEAVQAAGANLAIQIFATDTDESSLDIARAGIYLDAEVKNIPPARLQRFFTRKAGRCQVSKEIRDLVVFAQQNLTSDPPFSKLDLISCRNLLIYLDPQVQRKIIALFHFALREGGYLFLGNAETVSGHEELFDPVSRKWRIYRRIGAGRHVAVELPLYTGHEAGAAGRLPVPGGPAAWRQSLAYLIQQSLLERFAPAAAILDRRRQLLYSHGPVDRYLTVAPGEGSLDLIEMAREGLRTRLRAAVTKAVETGRPVTFTARVKRGELSTPVRVTLGPLRLPHETDELLLATFEDVKPVAPAAPEPVVGDTSARQLEDELRVTREELQSTIEQLEGSNEELKASNEETTAANEELQSANEELETSKEELQSLNEELNTVNSRLQERADELERSNNDLVNFQTSSNIGTVFLDREFKVRRYTPAVTALLSLIETDIGRPIGDVVRKFKDDALISEVRQVLATLTPRSAEVLADSGLWFIRRITPYRTRDDRIEGVVVTFVDVSDLKEAQARLECTVVEVAVAKDRLETVLASITDAYLVLDSDWRFVEVNPVAQEAFARPAAELLGKVIWDVFPQTVGGEVYEQYHAAVASGQAVHFEVKSRIVDKWWEIHAYPRAGRLEVYMREITARKEAEARLAYLASFPERNPTPVVEVDLEGNVRYANPAASRLFPDLGAQGTLHPWLADWAETARPLRAGRADSAVRDVTVGNRVYQQSFYLFAPEGMVRVYGLDITERRRAEEALRQLNAELEQRVTEQTAEIRRKSAYNRSLIEASLDPLVTIGPDGKITDVNAATERVAGLARGELIGTDFSDYFTGPDKARAGYEQVFREGLVRDYALEIRHRDGHTVPVLYNATVYRDEAGEVIGVFAAARDITEVKKAQTALQELNATLEQRVAERTAELAASEERLRSLYASMTEGVVVHEMVHDKAGTPVDYRLLEVNQAFETITGIARHRAVGALASELYGTGMPPYFERYSKVAQTGVSDEFETTFDPMVKSLHISVFSPAQGKFATVFMDITERKKAEAALRESEARFRSVLDHSRDVIYRLNLQTGRYEYISPSAETVVGYSPEELKAQDVESALAMIHPDDLPAMRAGLAHLDETGQAKVEYRQRSKSGEYRWVSNNMSLTGDGAGRPLYRDGNIRDITERKRAEEALRETRDYLDNLFNYANAPIIVWDPQLKITRFNAAFEHLTGRPAQEVLGREIDVLFPPDSREESLAHIRRTTSQRERWEVIEIRILHTSGDVRTVLWNSANVLASDHETVIATIAQGQDITERKKAEEVLRDLNANLESKVAQRTVQLQQRARQLQKMTLEVSQAEDRERKRMAEILHDDLQQIIAGAKFHVSLLRNRLKYDTSLQTIAAQIDQMLKDAIEKSRGLSHELSPAVLHHSDFAETLGWLGQQMQAKHGLVVSVHASGPAHLQSEAIKSFLYKAAQELLFNVVKHARVNEARIRFRWRGPYVCLSISDRGRGFDPRGLREAAGFGLLSIRERIELLGGRMKIKSAPGQGSTFFIVVPDGQEGREEGQNVGRKEDRMALPSDLPGGRRLRVLLADDHRIVREGLRLLLREEPDVEIVGEAAHGREAVDLALRLEPDVVIMDVSMPLIDGDAATRQIKEHLPQTRIIALSTCNEPETMEKMYRAGAEGYVLKTASSAELLAAIRGRAPES